jgi:hypothetical protein
MKFSLILLFSFVTTAQNRPQFVWQGQVDGIVVLRLHGNHLNVQIQEGSPVERQQFQFHDRLPDIHEEARVEMLEGRGYAHIIDQPSSENNYTLSVSIEDRQPGSSFYSIALYWDASTNSFEGSQGQRDKVAWSGRVDEDAMVSCRAKSCFAETHGAPVADEHFKFSRPLPNHDVQVNLEQVEGRGDVRLIEQPNERNRYTAQVSIHDPQSGAGQYSFVLAWSRGGKEPELRPAVRGLIWSGTVDGRVRVTLQGSAVLSEKLAGNSITGEQSDVMQPLPARSDLKPVVKKLLGRGDVQIIEDPSDKNNYRLVFEIRNTGTPDLYQIEVDW